MSNPSAPNQQRSKSAGVAPLTEAGQIHSDPKKKASILAHQFRSVFTQDDTVADDTYLSGPSYPPMADITIDGPGVMKLLKGVNPSKASGPDQIPCRLLHELHVYLAPVFTFLFQSSYDSGTFPAVWKSAWITLVFKKYYTCVASNYRPVSLTCVSSNLLEHILCSQIRNCLDQHGILSPYQHGWMVVKMWTLLFWIFLKRLMLCHINACCASYDYLISRGVHSNRFLAFYRVAPKVSLPTVCALILVIVPWGMTSSLVCAKAL